MAGDNRTPDKKIGEIKYAKSRPNARQGTSRRTDRGHLMKTEEVCESQPRPRPGEKENGGVLILWEPKILRGIGTASATGPHIREWP